MHTIEADYLVVGAGAMGMAFIDTRASETRASVVLVDRNHQPGEPSAGAGVGEAPRAGSTLWSTKRHLPRPDL